MIIVEVKPKANMLVWLMAGGILYHAKLTLPLMQVTFLGHMDKNSGSMNKCPLPGRLSDLPGAGNGDGHPR